MTIAAELEKRFSLIPADETGVLDYKLFDGFVETCLHKKVDYCSDRQRGSLDWGKYFLFQDGSAIKIVNSQQYCCGRHRHGAALRVLTREGFERAKKNAEFYRRSRII